MNIGNNLETIRKLRGLSQRELAKLAGLTQRIITYYENETDQISSKHLIKLSQILKVSTDEILGIKKIDESIKSEESKLLKKVKKILTLTKRDQQAVFHYINTLCSKKSK